MEINLYEYFNCRNREELYTKVKERSSSVQELLDYFEYAKEDLQKNFINNRIYIKNAKNLEDYLKNGNMPSKGELSIVMIDNGNRVLKDFKGKDNISDLEFIKNSHSKLGRVFILFANEASEEKINNIRSKFKKLDIDCLDTIEIKNNKNVYSELAQEYLDWNVTEEFFGRKENLINYETPEEQGKGISNLKLYGEFIEHYTKNELKGLNIVNDEKKINEILNLKNQHLFQENFCVIDYDKEYNITDYNIKSIGGLDRATIDLKMLASNLFDEKTEGIIVLHNHPSGGLKPSPSDLDITKEIDSLCRAFDKTLYDHLIFSKAGYFSFREENLIDNVSENVINKMEKKEVKSLSQNMIYAYAGNELIRHVKLGSEKGFQRILDDIDNLKNLKIPVKIFAINDKNEISLIENIKLEIKKFNNSKEISWYDFCQKKEREFINNFKKIYSKDKEEIIRKVRETGIQFEIEKFKDLLEGTNKSIIPKKKKLKDENQR